jgi:hypothetical protein
LGVDDIDPGREVFGITGQVEKVVYMRELQT